MQTYHPHALRRRARGAAILLVAGLGGLSAAFFEAQVVESSSFREQSEKNRLRPFPLPAPRGTIYDRNGAIVADNVPGYTLSILPAPQDTLRRMLRDLAPHLGLTREDVASLLAKQRRTPGQPLVVAADLTFDEVSTIEEHRRHLPGLYIDMRPKRHYPSGAALGHVVGHIGEIDEAELASPEFAGYAPGRLIGKAGLERQYEKVLGGVPGIRFLEMDAHGHVVGSNADMKEVEPAPGRDLYLYLDARLQEWVARVFPADARGAVVALDPATGHVLALYAQPGYDPNDFVAGVPPALWRSLTMDPGKPLLNRAIAGLYPPGSTWKLATAAVALELGVVDPLTHMPVPCRGGMQYGNRYFRCWDRAGHGELALADAIKQSCDVYFYQLGTKIGLERLLTEGTRLGFARTTGVDLPAERPGTFPDRLDWYRDRFGWAPTSAEVLNLAIGQGPNDQTALKMAQFFSALAAGGRTPAPRLAATDDAAPGAAWDLHLSEASLNWLREGLRRVVSPGGTAHLASLEHWDLIGKTGTSQNPHGKDHAWFVGIAGPRGGAGEIVVAVVVEGGEHGYTAAQYVAKTADNYLRRKHGIPLDSIQTLRDHLIAGRPARWAQWQ